MPKIFCGSILLGGHISDLTTGSNAAMLFEASPQSFRQVVHFSKGVGSGPSVDSRTSCGSGPSGGSGPSAGSGPTTFIVAHRLSAVKNADLIIVLQDGAIAERGNHEELVALGGYYAQLYEEQRGTK